MSEGKRRLNLNLITAPCACSPFCYFSASTMMQCIFGPFPPPPRHADENDVGGWGEAEGNNGDGRLHHQKLRIRWGIACSASVSSYPASSGLRWTWDHIFHSQNSRCFALERNCRLDVPVCLGEWGKLLGKLFQLSGVGILCRPFTRGFKLLDK